MNKVDLKFTHKTRPPVVEIDTEASSAYVRFSNGLVAKTLELETEMLTATADLDDQGEIVGIEFVGLEEFTIDKLFASRGIPCQLPQNLLSQTRYISAKEAACKEDAYDIQMIKDRADEPTISGDEVFKELGL